MSAFLFEENVLELDRGGGGDGSTLQTYSKLINCMYT